MRLLSYLLCLSCISILLKNPVSVDQKPDFYCKRACWISYLDFEQFLQDLDEDAFRAEVSRMYDVILSYELNTVIVQVRAFGDAIYPSDIFPFATYLSSNRCETSYDALAIMLDLAHEKGLLFEAWINPYRLSKDNKTSEAYKQTELYCTFWNVIIEYKNIDGETSLALDPASEVARELIVQGIDELLTNYDLDAIHFDDYFYMEHMADDLDDDEKISNVNTLIRNVHEHTAIHDVPFGISPAGNIEYARSIGADVSTWLKEPGYIDYIMPQLYWSDEYMMHDKCTSLYTDRCIEWSKLNQLDLPIYTGLGLYRVGQEDAIDKGWSTKDTNLKEQYELAKEYGYDGYCLFRYAWLEKDCAYKEMFNLMHSAKNTDDYNFDDSCNGVSKILVRLYKTDGTVTLIERPCKSFFIDMDGVLDVSITYLNADNEDCMAFYRTKRSDGRWNRWTFDGNFTNYEQFCTITEVKIMRIPRKTVKNTCFFVY